MAKPLAIDGCRQRGLTDEAVGVGDGSAAAADDMVVIVADPQLEASGVTLRLDPASESGVGEGREDPVHRLR